MNAKIEENNAKKVMLTHANFSNLVIQVIKSEAPYLKKTWSLISNISNVKGSNISNVKGWNWKKNFNYIKG